MSESFGGFVGSINRAYDEPLLPMITPLQALARAIKALSYTDMNTLGDEVEHQMRAVGLEFVHAILAAADKLEAGE